MTIFMLLLMILLLFVGMPVGFALGVAGVAGLLWAGGLDAVLGIVGTVPYRTAASYTLTAVPMFILMAEFIARSGVVEELFLAAHRWLERLRGGLAIATIIASAGMAALAGSSTASAATMANIAIPQLRKYGYSASIASGVVTVAGTLAIMIPPSIAFILYGLITETSIGQLLIAGIIPGILTAVMYCGGILAWDKMSPGLMPPPTHLFTRADRWRSLRPLWSFIILSSVVIGSMYTGLATPTEAAALGAFGALALGLLMKRIKLNAIKDAALRTVYATTMIFTIIIGAMIFGYFLTLTQTTQHVIGYVGSLNVPSWLIMGLILLLFLFLGCVMDQVAILFISLPLTFPLVMSMGYDPIWFGVICTKVGEIGLVTPPVGMNAYVVSAISKTPLEDVFRGSGMLLAVDFLSLILLLAFPALCTWLPSTMMKG